MPTISLAFCRTSGMPSRNITVPRNRFWKTLDVLQSWTGRRFWKKKENLPN